MVGNYRISFLAISLLSIVSCTYGDTNERSANFFTQRLTEKLRSQYNSHLLRLRRDALDLPQPTRNGMRFKVGVCQLEDFLHSAKNCSHVFYTSVRRRNTSPNQCGKEYQKLRQCMLGTLTGCIGDSRLASYLNTADVKEIKDNFLVFLGDEKFWCEQGGLGISSDYLPAGSMCQPVYYQLSKGCTETYSKLFNSTASNDKLCSAYQKAKKCYLQILFTHCTFSRMLRQMLEIMVEITADFQPFCKTTAAQERVKLEDLFLEKKCPPYSLADVAFVMDVTNGTDRWQFALMKKIIEGVTKTMDFGWSGIQASVLQYDTHLRSLIKFGRTRTQQTFQRTIRQMRRTTTKVRNKGKRMTGRALAALARSTFSPGKSGDALVKEPSRSGQRPHNPAVVFVFTRGQSKDSMVRGLEMLKDRGVHVVFVGPSDLEIPTTSNKLQGSTPPVEEAKVGSNNSPGSGVYRVIETNFRIRDLKDVVKAISEEICAADRWKQLKDGERFSEGRIGDSKWSSIQGLLSRFGEYDLSLLFELKPIIASNLQTTSSVPKLSATSFDPNAIEEGFDMDGDLYFGRPSEGVDETGFYPQSHYYINEQEYIHEAPY